MKVHIPLRRSLAIGAALALTVTGANLTSSGAAAARTVDCGTHTLPQSKLTINSTIAVITKCDFATLPLYEAKVNGVPVWYVITDVSDARLAKDLGLNFAPRLANVTKDCLGCAQVVKTNRRLGTEVINRPGKPDFSLRRVLVPGAQGFSADHRTARWRGRPLLQPVREDCRYGHRL